MRAILYRGNILISCYTTRTIDELIVILLDLAIVCYPLRQTNDWTFIHPDIYYICVTLDKPITK